MLGTCGEQRREPSTVIATGSTRWAATVLFFLKKKRKKERKKLIKSEWTTIYELDLIFSECFYCVLIQSDKEVLCQRQLAGNTNCEMCGCLNNYPHAKPHKCNCHSVSFGKERVKRCPGKWSKK